MVRCTQLLALFQSSLTALAFQVALPAKLLLVVERTSVRIAAMTLERIGSFIAAYFSLQAIEGWRLFDSVTDCLVFIWFFLFKVWFLFWLFRRLYCCAGSCA